MIMVRVQEKEKGGGGETTFKVEYYNQLFVSYVMSFTFFCYQVTK